jgi:hypothetical protein
MKINEKLGLCLKELLLAYESPRLVRLWRTRAKFRYHAGFPNYPIFNPGLLTFLFYPV